VAAHPEPRPGRGGDALGHCTRTDATSGDKAPAQRRVELTPALGRVHGSCTPA